LTVEEVLYFDFIGELTQAIGLWTAAERDALLLSYQRLSYVAA
jgi:hypothetical protein